MIITIKNDIEKRELKQITDEIIQLGLKFYVSNGLSNKQIYVATGTDNIDFDLFKSFEGVTGVKSFKEPYVLANRKFKKQDTVVAVGQNKIGGANFCFIAGPCSVESESQIVGIAKRLKDSGVTLLRGGAFKPRTSPYSFQGLKEDGIKYLLSAKKETGLSVVTEITDVRKLDLYRDVDVLQIGARSMQNFELLKEVGKTKKPVLLKRGFASTLEEWLLSSEYLLSEGATDVILCERGVRGFESVSRATLDISSIPIVKEMTHLPIIVDPSHAVGLSRYVKRLSLAAAAVGSDGLMIEVHDCPKNALSDGKQAVTPDEFDDIITSVRQILPIVGKAN